MMTEILGERIFDAVMISATVAVVTLISPSGEMKKYIDLIAALCVIAAIAVPIISAVPSLSLDHDIAWGEDIEIENGHSGVVYEATEIIEKRTAADIAAKFNIDIGDIDVCIVLDTTELSSIDITDVYITLPRGHNIADLKKYTEELFLNTAAVHITEVNDE